MKHMVKTPLLEAKEVTPKVRNAGHFLFTKDMVGNYAEVAKYTDAKSFVVGVKERVKTLDSTIPAPDWYYFRGTFKPVGIERTSDVKVRV